MGILISCKKIGEFLLLEDLEAELDLKRWKELWKEWLEQFKQKRKLVANPLKEILKLFLSETLERSDLAIKERLRLILNFFIMKKHERILR